jgi:hypothetical protein
MLERNRVDNMVQAQTVPVPAELTLDDQSVLTGDLMLPASRPVHEVLNGPSVFIEFRAYGKPAMLLAKGSIRALKFLQVPSADQLRTNTRRGESFDPHTVLGVPASASYEEVRKAYVALAKAYHPDRYANADLPAEVRDYLAAMARRINLAFQSLDKAHKVTAGRAPTMAEPIYTSSARA